LALTSLILARHVSPRGRQLRLLPEEQLSRPQIQVSGLLRLRPLRQLLRGKASSLTALRAIMNTLFPFQAGVTTTRHLASHSMQCILTRADYDLYYGGDGGGPQHMGSSSATVAGAPEETTSYSCPYCPKGGFTVATLIEHVSSQHADATHEVICPICASLPGGDPNLVTDDLAAHLTLEHRNSGPRDLISFLDSPGQGSSSGGGHAGGSISRPLGVRRMPHTSRGGAARARRAANVHANASNAGHGGSALSSALSPSAAAAAAAAARDSSVDPIAELLSQLSGVRRSAAAASSATSSSSSSSQLQQLQMQLQMERQAAHHRHAASSSSSAAVDQRLSSASSGAPRPARSSGFTFGSSRAPLSDMGFHPQTTSVLGGSGLPALHPPQPAHDVKGRAGVGGGGASSSAANCAIPPPSQRLLLAQSSDEDEVDEDDVQRGRHRLRRGVFVQELVLATLSSASTSTGE